MFTVPVYNDETDETWTAHCELQPSLLGGDKVVITAFDRPGKPLDTLRRPIKAGRVKPRKAH